MNEKEIKESLSWADEIIDIIEEVKKFKSVYSAEFYDYPNSDYFRAVIQLYDGVKLADFDEVYTSRYDLLHRLTKYFDALYKKEKWFKLKLAFDTLMFYVHLFIHTLEILVILFVILVIYLLFNSTKLYDILSRLFG